MKPVKLSLVVVLLMSGVLVARCAIHGYWSTGAAAAMLLVGALAGLAGRTWGVGLTLLAASAFPAAHLLGMASPLFWGIGFVGALPFAFAWKPMAFFDRPATKLYASLAIGGGIACAITWHEIGAWVVANLYP